MNSDKNNKILRIEDKLGDVPFYIARFNEEIKKTTPHKHDNYYELVYLKEGEGFHWVEEKKFIISPPEFYYLIPYQLHHWEFTSIPKGYVILFKRSYFNNVYDCHIYNLIFKLTGRFKVGIPEGCSPEYLLQEMLEEYTRSTEFSLIVIHGLLTALLARILQFVNIQASERDVPLKLYEKYQDLILKECSRIHKVKDFAEMLNTTPQNLNSICRRQTGKNAKAQILSHILLEAKRYLLHTENTLKEITHILQFNDTSYFVKFFKKQEGMSPVQFKKQYFH